MMLRAQVEVTTTNRRQFDKYYAQNDRREQFQNLI